MTPPPSANGPPQRIPATWDVRDDGDDIVITPPSGREFRLTKREGQEITSHRGLIDVIKRRCLVVSG